MIKWLKKLFTYPKLKEYKKLDDNFHYLLELEDGNSYRGSCTVWHHFPSGQRCSIWLEGYLSEVWNRIEWGLDKEKEVK